jgi:hypothetical protein
VPTSKVQEAALVRAHGVRPGYVKTRDKSKRDFSKWNATEAGRRALAYMPIKMVRG